MGDCFPAPSSTYLYIPGSSPPGCGPRRDYCRSGGERSWPGRCVRSSLRPRPRHFSGREAVETGHPYGLAHHFRVMELMAPGLGPRRAQETGSRQGHLPVAQGLEPGQHLHREGEDPRHGWAWPSRSRISLGQIHEPAAFGVDGEPRGGTFFESLSHTCIGCQLGGIKLRVPTAQVDAVQVGGQFPVFRGEKGTSSAPESASNSRFSG